MIRREQPFDFPVAGFARIRFCHGERRCITQSFESALSRL